MQICPVLEIDIEMLTIEIPDIQETNTPALVVSLSSIAFIRRISSPASRHARAFELSTVVPMTDANIFRVNELILQFPM